MSTQKERAAAATDTLSSVLLSLKALSALGQATSPQLASLRAQKAAVIQLLGEAPGSELIAALAELPAALDRLDQLIYKTTIVDFPPALLTGGEPVLTGAATVGATLTLSTGSWSNSPATYQRVWQVSANPEGGWTTISSQVGATYVAGSTTAGKYIRAGVRASNVAGDAAGFAYSLPVGPIAAALSITGSPPVTGVVGAAYSFTPTISGGRAPYTVALTGTAPSGTGFNATTGQLSGTLTTAETHTGLKLTVTDADGLTKALGPWQVAVAASAGSSHAPSVTPSDHVEKYFRDYSALGAVSLNAGTTDSGIVADTGELKPGHARYRSPNYREFPFTAVGIPGFGCDVYTDPILQSLLPAEYIVQRPLGEIEPMPGVGIRLWARPSTGPAMTAILRAQFPAIADRADAKGNPIWCAALLTSYRKISARPPFVRATWFIPRSDYSDAAFMASMWSTEDGNHSYSEDAVWKSPFEYDDDEGFPVEIQNGGIDQLDRATTTHGFASGSNAETGYQKGWNGGNLKDKLVLIVTVAGPTVCTTYHSVDGSPLVAHAVKNVSDMGGVNYDQPWTGFIHDIGAGFSWQNNFPTGPVCFDLVKTGLWAPASNAEVVVPSTTPPAEVGFAWRSTYGTSIPEDIGAGVTIGDLTLPAGVTSARAITYGGRLAVVGTEVRTAGAGLDYETQSVLTFHIEGIKADGAKSVGRRWSTPVTDIAEGDWWTPSAKLSLNPPVTGARALGVEKVYSKYLVGRTVQKADGQGSTGMAVMLPGRAPSGTIRFRLHGLEAGTLYGLMGSDYLDGDLRQALMAEVSSVGVVTLYFRLGSLNHQLVVPGMTSPSSPLAAVLSWGSNGVAMWANGSDQMAVHDASWPATSADTPNYGVGCDGFFANPIPDGNIDRIDIWDNAGGTKLSNDAGKALAVHL